MRLRTFDDGGRLRVSACRRYQGSMSTSLPADGCGRLYHNRLLPCGVQKEAATAATEAKRRCGRATLSVATSATLPAHRAAFGRDRRDPPGASRSFRSRQARPSRRSHIAEGPRFRSRQARPSRHIMKYAPRRGRRGYFACRAVRAKPGNRPCGDQALATLIFAACPLRSQEAASGHAANESAVASVSAFT